ncbi:NAD-dependent epimerase/dehydratase family protein [Zavarzinia sp.]|uniref:NAD-dependent epimerase/dehydratase family protein n=1 Tax=Zavarzinia sp. TaxID=2027920 RepID=UPI00356821BD
MKLALVLGATGGLGSAVARRLAAGGWTVRALHRHPESLGTAEPFEWVRGDAMVPADVARAAEGVPVIVHAVKPRLYRDWHDGVLPMIDNTIAAARGARIVVPGNVYNYGPDAGAEIGEEAPQHPETGKGRLRVEMERRIADAVAAGKAKALILRAGDFFGPGAGSSWFSEAMVTPGRRPRVIRNPGRPGVGHQWAYLPDLAETMVQLIEHDPLPDFARFHMDGHWDADGTQMAAAIVRVLGRPAVKVAPLPWWAVALAAPFKPDFRELLELKYLWQRPVRLRNDRLLATLGREPHTPLDEAVRATLESILPRPVAASSR